MNSFDDAGFIWFLCGVLVFGAIVYLAEGFSWDMDLRRNHRPLYDKRWQDGSVGAIAFMLEPLLQLWDWVKRKRRRKA